MHGKMPEPGDIFLAKVQFTDTYETKVRPVLVLFEDMSNVVVAGVTSNKKMKGIPLTKKDGAFKDSVIKLNYIFTISASMLNKFLFHLNKEKKKVVYEEFQERFRVLLE